MRTTIRLRDDLLKRAKRRASAEGRTFTSLVEEGLTLALSRLRPSKNGGRSLPVSAARGGVVPGVDLDSSADLESSMEGR